MDHQKDLGVAKLHYIHTHAQKTLFYIIVFRVLLSTMYISVCIQ